jgi:PASTA domain
MAMSKRTRVILIIGVLAVAAYFAYRWYENNQANQVSFGDSTGTNLGSNLNSPAPVLEGGSDSSDNSAPGYSTGSETINVTLPNGDQSTTGSGTTTTSTGTSTTGTGTTSTPQVAVPNVVGMSQASAFAKLSASGLHATGTKTIPGKVLTVQTESPKAGTKVNSGSTVTLVSAVKK